MELGAAPPLHSHGQPGIGLPLSLPGVQGLENTAAEFGNSRGKTDPVDLAPSLAFQ